MVSDDPRGQNNSNVEEEDGHLSSGSMSSIDDQDEKGGNYKLKTLRKYVSCTFIMLD